MVDDEEVRLQRLDVLGNLRIELHHLVEDALEEGAEVVLALQLLQRRLRREHAGALQVHGHPLDGVHWRATAGCGWCFSGLSAPLLERLREEDLLEAVLDELSLEALAGEDDDLVAALLQTLQHAADGVQVTDAYFGFGKKINKVVSI